MSNFTGMDINGVRTLAGQLDQAASQIKDLVGRLSGALEGTQWVGPDATRFRGDWSGTHVAALNNVANNLAQASQIARQNASEQESASNA